MTGFLGKEDLRQLTGAARRAQQIAKLREKGIPFTLEGDAIVVMWVHVQAYQEGRPTVSYAEPDFSSLGG